MATARTAGSGLRGYRVLDLTDEKGFLCGKILGDLGADVIKIEPPGGDPGRRQGPFYGNRPDPESSLHWWAYNTSKRGITLDITSEQGRRIFLELVRKSDLVVESFTPGYLENIGLGYEKLNALNPSLVVVSITGFGQSGPYASFKAPDIVVQAMAGYINLVGETDRPPLRISIPQAYLHASNDAAAAALIALYHRERTGEGQWVDISAQECVVWETFSNHQYWFFQKIVVWRADAGTGLTPGMTRTQGQFMECKDGYVLYNLVTGQQGHHTRAVLKWMGEEGMHDEVLNAYNWEQGRIGQQLTKEDRERLRDEILAMKDRLRPFFMTKTKRELFDEALARGFMLAPVCMTPDLLSEEHFQVRKFWQAVSQPQANARLLHPGAPFQMEHKQYRIRRRAPMIGEHNDVILGDKLKSLRKRKPRAPLANVDNNEVFKGLKVIDLTWVTVGPRAVRYLADHGATVVKIESPDRPDIGRLVPPYKDEKPEADRSAWFANYNVNRYGMTVDLSKPEGLDLAKRLIRWADVLVESYRPGVIPRLGLGYNVAKELNPRLIYASTSQLGQYGPSSQFGGYGHHAAAMCGFDDITGWPDRVPSGVFWAYTDHIAPQYLVSAIVTALLEREKTGKGQYIDQSQNESGIQFLATQLLDYQANGTVATRMGNRDRFMSPHGAFRCQGFDRWCGIAVASDEEWRVFCQVTGLTALIKDKRFSTFEKRQENEDELERLTEAWSVNQKAEDVMDRLQGAGIAAGVVQNAYDLDIDPHFTLRRHWLTFGHPVMGEHQVDALPPRFSKTPARQYLPDPCLGEHNAYVCTEILGMTDEEFIALVAAGVFGTG
ncbi:MAG: CoA transferase [Dehalococcoidia bacterium]|nr:CoA transferase [Dehalococcoidia bacterium]